MKTVWLLVGILCSGGWIVMGQDVNEPAAPPTELSLSSFLEQVVANNHGWMTRRLEMEIRDWEVKGERAAFQPDLVGRGGYQDTERLNTVEQSISQDANYFSEQRYSYSAGLEGVVPWAGTTVWLGSEYADIANNLTNRYGRTAASEHQNFLGVSITQPLLRNAGPKASLARLNIATAKRDVEYQGSRKYLISLVAVAEGVYWDQVQAQELVTLQTESLETARHILQDCRARAEAGKMPEIEVLQAEAGVSLRESQLYDVEDQFIDAKDRALTLLTLGHEAGQSYQATDLPEADQSVAPYAEAVDRALRTHPDYLLQEQVILQSGLEVAFFKNQRWPQLDLFGSYGLNGLGNAFNSSWDQVQDGEYPVWSVRMELRFPLGWDSAPRSQYEVARLRNQQSLLDLKAAEVEIANSIHTSMQKVDHSRERIGKYREVEAFYLRMLDNEITRLKAGQSDTRRVLDVEDDYSEARRYVLSALVNYRKDLVAYRVAAGTLLDQYGLEPDPGNGVARGLETSTGKPPAGRVASPALDQPVPAR